LNHTKNKTLVTCGLTTLTKWLFFTQRVQCVLLFLVLGGKSALFNFYVVTHSYSSRPFLHTLCFI